MISLYAIKQKLRSTSNTYFVVLTHLIFEDYRKSCQYRIDKSLMNIIDRVAPFQSSTWVNNIIVYISINLLMVYQKLTITFNDWKMKTFHRSSNDSLLKSKNLINCQMLTIYFVNIDKS